MKTRLATSFIALSTAIATPALADVTAADVFSNQQAFYNAMGVNMGGQLSGGMLTNPEINIILPQGIASLQIKTDAVNMANNNDGTVTISYPSPMTFTVAGGAPNEGSFSAEMSMTHDGYTIIASGNPGEITYQTNAEGVEIEFVDLTFEGGLDAQDMSLEGTVSMASLASTSVVSEGNLIEYSADSAVGEIIVDMAFLVDNIVSKNTQTTLPTSGNISMSLPVGGIDIMNISAALRDGLSLSLTSNGEGTRSSAETTLNGEVINRQITSTGAQTTTMSLDENGFVAVGEASDFAMTFNDQMLFPGDLDVAMQAISMNYDIPLNASEDPQDFRVATSMQGVTLGDTIWNLFDPAGILPRDPAEVSFDVTGNGTNGTDLLDFMAMSQMFGPPAIEVDDLTIENLRIAAAGAEATATGAMTFDWTDFQTIPGIARPEGQVTINLNGANALMDNLVAMGLIPEEELMMPRMMMGMFATPVGDDMLQTVLEVNSEGHVLANGQRLQ